jgi:multidrug resistance efflux pump
MSTDVPPERLARVMELARRLSVTRSPQAFAELLEHAALEIADADRARCYYYEAESSSVWRNINASEIEEHSAEQGLAGWSAKNASSLSVALAPQDPRFNRAIDDPAGDGSGEFLVEPIIDPDRQVHAVVLLVKSRFTAKDQAALAVLAREAGVIARRLAMEVELADALQPVHENALTFRAEAVEAHLERRVRGSVVRVTPPWIEWTYALLLVMLVAAGAYLVLGSIDRYSTGPAIVEMHGRTDVTANVGGTVVAVEVAAGAAVEADQILVRLYDDEEAAELERIRAQFESQLRNWMRDPRDSGANQAVRELRGQLESAEARLSRRTIVAPHAGMVVDLHVRTGQHIEPGDSTVSIAKKEQTAGLVALLPGSDRPLLEPGMSARFEVSGYRYAYQRLTVESVSEEVFSPKEAMRVVGQKLTDGIPIVAAVVLVRFQLPSDSFEADGEYYRYHDGMRGTVEVRVRSENILATLIPALKQLGRTERE